MIASGERFLCLPEVLKMTGYKKSTIYDMMAQTPPAFPTRKRIGPNKVIWLESEVRAWMEQRLTQAA
ncbi:AlpA family phage regulatory protein [Sphingomonas naphthae]|uniref:AlpA family phage regulatory protein n=1 Tax=Sphingomonas naphthae TaxID=1813468 RepID=A0ABY7TPQ3_9SPHN|nr:AlpA family phage regulatory protein [Sphingomonas naphthae]WCT75008.1 AlpA family phage regulatory protein [Sphingomonas naphthae]